ncbi:MULTISPECIES: hypothetical protein [unclassified Myroides]|uniref:hypothetical protein n=1 Tax=unclassified Myroides TaxID=2642485 RepID=UPI003D2F836C
MKKLVAICALVALPIAISSCSSDDNSVIRKPDTYVGIWETDSLFYTFNGREMKHRFNEMPGGDDAITKDIMTLTDDKATVIETNKKGVDQSPIQGTIADKVITLTSTDPRHTPRTIKAATDKKLTVEYNIDMRGAELPVTVTYNRLK